MGLDMYLERRHYVKQWGHIPPEKQFEVTVKRGGVIYPMVDPKRVSYVIEQVAYWRKANAIHGWFVDNVQGGNDDCADYYVSREQLQELLDKVNACLEHKADPKEVLPTRSGFFFGSTDYDEDYEADLQDTKRQLEPLLAEPEGDHQTTPDYYYRASW